MKRGFTLYNRHSCGSRNLKTGFRKSAFTLIELSIVLIIIGLLVGGVLAGRELIEAAKMRSQVNQLQNFELSYNTFKLKYDAAPGDYEQADLVFSGASAGDGDGVIEHGSTTGYDPAVCFAEHTGEQVEFFTQLAAANLINPPELFVTSAGGNMVEIAMSSNTAISVGSRYGDAGNGFYTAGTQLLEEHDPQRGAVLCLIYADISQPNGYNVHRYQGVASPEKMQRLDIKSDDGLPKSGKLIAFRPHGSTQGNCTSSASPYDSYDLTETRSSCHGMYTLEY